MEKGVYYKWLFIIAAIHAWLLSVPVYILSFIEPPFTGEMLYYYQFTYGAVILFALGYFIVGLDIEKNFSIYKHHSILCSRSIPNNLCYRWYK